MADDNLVLIMGFLKIFIKELWHNQPNTVIGAGVAILVLLEICIWLLNFISIKNFISHKNFEGSWSYFRQARR